MLTSVIVNEVENLLTPADAVIKQRRKTILSSKVVTDDICITWPTLTQKSDSKFSCCPKVGETAE